MRYDNYTVYPTASHAVLVHTIDEITLHHCSHRGFVVYGDEVIFAGVLHKVAPILPLVQRLVSKPVKQK